VLVGGKLAAEREAEAPWLRHQHRTKALTKARQILLPSGVLGRRKKESVGVTTWVDGNSWRSEEPRLTGKGSCNKRLASERGGDNGKMW